MISLAISDAVLAFASAFPVFLLSQQKDFDPAHKLPAKAALFGFLLMTVAGGLGALNYGFSTAWAGSYWMFNNMATFMSPPLVTIAMGQILMAKFWSAAAWWRTILAICLLFEVSRWYGLETVYRDLQLTLCIIAGLVMVTRSYMNAGTKALIMVSFASFFVGGMLIGNEGTIAGYLRLNLFRYFIALGNLMLGTGLYFLLRQKKPEKL
ncbi:hypothetical protein NX722_26190 [Endozoicomonas gorgoniicola]|uniref:Uncharacterized protein n=1 Tax=Endozoicomonas gorgoniicola TaxID=1234144 RepID=A0ABT3N345_9GAMM|nr:hypothetical protein [Endozoicomonas gorgoniicola]MCW7556055.1 hypothetical protein [Endozoicomonas gorgoniicola]